MHFSPPCTLHLDSYTKRGILAIGPGVDPGFSEGGLSHFHCTRAHTLVALVWKLPLYKENINMKAFWIITFYTVGSRKLLANVLREVAFLIVDHAANANSCYFP